MHTLGLEEWKRIAQLSTRIGNIEHQTEVKREAIYNVNAAYFLELVPEEEYKQLCIANRCHKGTKSLGLESRSKHHVPSGIQFQERTYIKTDAYEGLCYIDCAGEECFQTKENLNKTSLYHCIALLNECTDDQCLPFRMKLISWLFHNLRRIEDLKTLSDKVELIKKEYQHMFSKTNEDMARLIKWKTERVQWAKDALKPTIFDSMLKKPRSKRRK